jgi:hypothetical protein
MMLRCARDGEVTIAGATLPIEPMTMIIAIDEARRMLE